LDLKVIAESAVGVETEGAEIARETAEEDGIAKLGIRRAEDLTEKSFPLYKSTVSHTRLKSLFVMISWVIFSSEDDMRIIHSSYRKIDF
jgi:hypothetical protein